MYFEDHPPPHFHAIYGGHEAQVSIETLRILEGSVPNRVVALVREWAALHVEELQENWRKAQGHIPLDQIDPLE
jgi:hypothetical protein